MSTRASSKSKAESSKASLAAQAAAKRQADSLLIQNYLKQQAVKPGASAAKPTAAAPAKPAAAGPPAAPSLVSPFMNADDLAALNDFTTNYATNLSNIDFNLGNQAIDTDYQKTQTDTVAKEQTSATADSMAARGLFRSSIKDAALYDIEAQRALSNKFLDDKMTAATLNAGTQKQILGQSKVGFDTAMASHEVANASAVNDPLSAAWATQMAAYKPPAAPKPAAPAKPKAAAAPKPAAPPKPKVVAATKSAASTDLVKATAARAAAAQKQSQVKV